MDLLTPDIGLLFWMTLSFLILLFVLSKYAWKPIMKAIEQREQTIQASLDEAKRAREEMANLTAENEKILKQARIEREAILKEAKQAKDKIITEARNTSIEEGNKLIEAAKESIKGEKIAAVNQIKKEIADLSVGIAQKIIQEKLTIDEEQVKLIESLINKAKLN